MRIEKCLFLFFVIFAAASCSGQKNANPSTVNSLKNADSPAKNEFESKEGDFKVNFPCEPIKSERPTDSNFGNKTIHFFECGNEIARYSVSFEDFTKKIANPKEVFNEQKKMRIAGMEESAKIVSETEKTVNGFPAVYLETELSAGEVFPKAGLFSELHSLNGQRYYSVLVTVLAKDGQTPRDISAEIRSKTKQFIDSFEIVAK